MIPLFPKLHPRFRPARTLDALSLAELEAEENAAFKAQGEWIIKEVGFPLVKGDALELGRHSGFLIAELGQIVQRKKQGDMSGRRDAAKAISKAARGLRQALHDYERGWGYVPAPGDFSAVSRRDAEAMLNRLSKQFEDESRDAAADMVWRSAFAKFISGTLAPVYEMRFGRNAATSRNSYSKVTGGPFPRFVNSILSAAGDDASIADDTIAKALKRQKSKKKPTQLRSQKTKKAAKQHA